MIPFVALAIGGWNWVEAHGLLMVLAVNFAVLACAIGSAVCGASLSRRLDRLTLEVRLSRIPANIATDDRHTEAPAAPAASGSGETNEPSPVRNPAALEPGTRKDYESVRREISAIRGEISENHE